MKRAENSQGRGLRQGWKTATAAESESDQGGCQSQQGLEGLCKDCALPSKGSGTVGAERHGDDRDGVVSFLIAASKTPGRNNLKGGRGFVSFRVSDLVHPSKENQVEGAAQFIHSKRVQETELGMLEFY